MLIAQNDDVSTAGAEARDFGAPDQPAAAPTGPVIIVDPSRSYAELLADRLRQDGLCRAAHVCQRSSDGVERATAEPGTLVISELNLGDGSAVSLAESLKAQQSLHRQVILSHRIVESTLTRLLPLQLGGYLLKSEPLDRILQGLRVVLQGGHAFSEPVRKHLPSGGGSPRHGGFLAQLTPRQLDVLIFLAEGQSVKQVSQQMHLSNKAVDSLKYRMMKQLGFHDRVQLTRYAIREGLIEP